MRFTVRPHLLSALLVVLLGALPTQAQQHPNRTRGFYPGMAYQLGQLDDIALFNGNLNLSLPIGQSYPVSSQLSYQLQLSYSGNVWELQDWLYKDQAYVVARARLESNAGLGWHLGLGRLKHSTFTGDPNFGLPVYESPDGSSHVLGRTSLSTFETRDSTFLRFLQTGGIHSLEGTLEFPDGLQKDFDSAGRLTAIRDRFGNAVTVTYGTVGGNDRWEISDGHRTHWVYFKGAPYYGQVVDRVDLAAFGGARAVYTFTHVTRTVTRGCDQAPRNGWINLPNTETVPFLVAVTRPDGSKYAMRASTTPAASDDYYTTEPGTCSDRSGHLKGITLPTLGRLEWDWQSYVFPIDSSPNHPNLRGSQGIAERRTVNASGQVEGRWTYAPVLTPVIPLREMVNTVTDPLGHARKHYFSVYADTTTQPPQPPLGEGWNFREYGLPFTRDAARTSAGRHLSTEVIAASGTRERKIYVRYEGTTYDNPRLASRRVQYSDDGNRYVDEDRSDWDGFGHYRRVITSGSWASGTREVYTHYTGHPPSAPWILNTYRYRTVTQDGKTARQEFCWEEDSFGRPNTGFLERVRTIASDSGTRGAHDLLEVRARNSAGFVTQEKSYGGDGQALSTSASTDLCDMALPSEGPEYEIANTFQYGALKTSKHLGMTHYDAQFDLDASTGLAKRSYDSAGLWTDLFYDTLGRPIAERPQAGHDAWRGWSYARATPSALAKVETKSFPNGSVSQVLTHERAHFDGLGRPLWEDVLMPDGVFSRRETRYDAAGNVRLVTERFPIGDSPPGQTHLSSYDAFGRPGAVTRPDGTVMNYAYKGDRWRRSKVKVGTGHDSAGNLILSDAYTEEVSDPWGRLSIVREPTGPGGSYRSTNYTYDVGNRLHRVSMGVQTRLFEYDQRGLLEWEQHPEKGAFGNGKVYYFDYDSRGNARRRREGTTSNGARDLLFEFDAGSRLTEIRERRFTNGLQRPLKVLTYATANSGSNRRKGKLETATRHNWLPHPVLPGVTLELNVVETYTYAGRGGRVSAKNTWLNTSDYEWDQTFSYDPLGHVSSIGYPECRWATCASSSFPPRTVSSSYHRGRLTQISGFAGITYHPSGLVHQVSRTSGVVDTQIADPNGMARPHDIRVSSHITGLGPYGYDGAGNIVNMGCVTASYDHASRLKDFGACGSDGQSFLYDRYGNLTQTTTTLEGNTTVRTTATQAATNHLSTASYDEAGNQLTWGGLTYTYDAFNMMSTLSGFGNQIAYVYTADDERIWISDWSNAATNGLSGNVEIFRLRDLNGQVLREYVLEGINAQANWRLERDYVHRGGQLLASVSPDPAEGLRHYHLDHLGTPRVITNATGANVRALHYWPYGESIAPNNQPPPLQFTGHERDYNASSGSTDDLDYMHARFYSPLTARFGSVDPASATARVPQSWNKYPYVMGRPLVLVDSTGQVAELFNNAGRFGEVFFGLVGGFHDSTTVTPLRTLFELVDRQRLNAAFTPPDIDPRGYELNLFERLIVDLPIDGEDFGVCVEHNRFDWGAVTAFTIGNPLLNRLAGDTGRMGFGGLGPHPTSWQHKLGARLSRTFKNPVFSRSGKLVGRVALIPTVFEGYYDIGAIGRCAVVTGGS